MKIGPIDKDKAVGGRMATCFFVITLSLRHPITAIDYNIRHPARDAVERQYWPAPQFAPRSRFLISNLLSCVLGMENGASIYCISSISTKAIKF